MFIRGSISLLLGVVRFRSRAPSERRRVRNDILSFCNIGSLHTLHHNVIEHASSSKLHNPYYERFNVRNDPLYWRRRGRMAIVQVRNVFLAVFRRCLTPKVSDRASDYTIGEPIGFGASSIVYSAQYHPPSDASRKSNSVVPCALKVLDLDSLPPRSLQLLQRETTLMSLSKHPNVLRVRGSWMDGHKLHIALRLMNKGSAADVMRYGWPGGMEEDVVRCILRQALKGLKFVDSFRRSISVDLYYPAISTSMDSFIET